MTITSEKLRHWAEMAPLSPDGFSSFSAEQITQIADHIDAQAARISELEHERDAATLEYDYLNDQIKFHVEEVKRLYKELKGTEADNETLVSINSELATELEALREQPAVGTFVQWDTGDEEAGPELEWVESKLKEAIPLYRQPVPPDPVAVPDNETLHQLIRVWHRASSQQAAWDDMREVLRLNSGSVEK